MVEFVMCLLVMLVCVSYPAYAGGSATGTGEINAQVVDLTQYEVDDPGVFNIDTPVGSDGWFAKLCCKKARYEQMTGRVMDRKECERPDMVKVVQSGACDVIIGGQ